MARKTKKQQDAQSQVEARLTGDVPVRLDASSVVAGGSKGGATKSLREIHPSLESATTALEGAGLQQGTITTSSGMSVQVSRPKSTGPAPYKPQAPEFGNPKASPVQEGVSQRFEQRIGREHGRAKAAELTAEADAVGRAPNPLRSDGHVDLLTSLHSPSMGGNRLGHGGQLSALAKMDDMSLAQSKLKSRGGPRPDTSNFPSLANGPAFQGGKDMALHALGYTDAVQTAMLGTARDRIARRQGRGLSPALSEAEIHSRAYGQVNEHLDEALHGTKQMRKGDSTQSLINDLAAQQEAGSRGYSVKRDAPEEGAGQAPRRGPAPTGPGMTKSRTPNQRAQRQAVRDLTRQPGGWSALQDADAHTAAAANDLKVLDLRQKARRAGAVAPENRNTDSPGAQPEQKARRHAQPVFSTSRPGVGVSSEPGKAASPVRARPGAVSPTPSNLPTEPARLGRTREERGLGPRDYTPDIKAYEASRPKISAKTGGAVDVKAGLKQEVLKPDSKGKPTGVPTVTDKNQRVNKVEASNVAVAQTALDPAGLSAARNQNVSLGQRAPQGARSKRPTVR